MSDPVEVMVFRSRSDCGHIVVSIRIGEMELQMPPLEAVDFGVKMHRIAEQAFADQIVLDLLMAAGTPQEQITETFDAMERVRQDRMVPECMRDVSEG